MTTSKNKMSHWLSLILPGLFLLGFNIGTGSVTSMAKAGAEHGMTLLWTIVASCLCTFFMINLYGRYTIITGETALQAFKKHIHPAVALFFIVALTTGVCGSVMGVMGIVAEVSFEWSKSFVDGGIKPLYFAMFFIGLVYFIFWEGNTGFFERSLAVIVAVMALAFVANFFILMPPISDVVSGLIPNMSALNETSQKSPHLIIAAMVGTTVFSGLFIIRTTLVKEAGWTLSDFKKQRFDAAVSVFLMFVISAAIMGSTAGSLYVSGVTLEKASQMMTLLEPLAGALATSIFAVGIIAAGVSSQFPNILMLPWLLCDYRETKRDMTLPQYRILVLAISLLGLVVPLFDARPIFIMVLSQTFNAFILPATVLCIFYLTNKRELMGDYKNNWIANSILSVILAFSLFTSLISVEALINTLSNLLK